MARKLKTIDGLIDKWGEYQTRISELDRQKNYLDPSRYWSVKQRYENIILGIRRLLDPRNR